MFYANFTGTSIGGFQTPKGSKGENQPSMRPISKIMCIKNRVVDVGVL